MRLVQKVSNKFPSFLTIGTALSVFAQDAAACGGGGITSQGRLVVDAQRIVISSRQAGTTDIVAQITVPSTTSNYGMLIPVPSEPTLDPEPVSAEELDRLDSATAPVIQIEEKSSDGSLIGCGSMNKTSDTGRGVTAAPPVEIGPVVAVALKGDTVAEINVWLEQNEFQLPSSDAQILERYVDSGSYFIAIKRSDNAADGAPSSIGIHYSLAGDHRMVSLAFAQLGADSEVGFTLFLATRGTMGPSAPFKALTLSDLDSSLLKESYTDALRKAVRDNDSQAFVLESATPASNLASMLPKLSSLLDQDAVITRATTLVAREELTTDAMFATPFTGKITATRRLSSLTKAPRSIGAEWFGVVMVGAAMSFSFRRRKP